MSYSSLSNQSLHNQASGWSCLLGCNENGLPSTASLQFSSAKTQQGSRPQPSDETTELVMSEFNKLSIDQQAKALDDIYSAGSELKENPAMIDRLLTDFGHIVEQGSYPIYELAVNQDRSYVEDPSFRLIFLRANMHNVSKAVKQMISFLQQKAKYFGAEKVARDITLDDLTPGDLKLLLSGSQHIQDGADRNGRVVVYTLSPPADDFESQIRAVYYLYINILVPMLSVQRKGIVFVLYPLRKPGAEQTFKHGIKTMKRFAEFMNSLPLKTSAFHFCMKQEGYIAPLQNAYVQLCLRAMPKHMRERSCAHIGSPMELRYKLSTFSIPQDTFPIDMSGNLRESIQNVWFYKHLEKEGGISQCFITNSAETDDELSNGKWTSARMAEMEVDDEGDRMSIKSSDSEDVAIRPPYSSQDVLLGKGYSVQNHPGNIAFREFLRGHQEEYDNAPRLSKRKVSENLTRAMMADGVRFWQTTADGDSWTETNFNEAVKKVSQIFRTRRKKIR